MGCLAGLGLTLGFFVLSGLIYLLLGMLGLTQNMRLLVALVAGPTVGTGLVLIGWLLYTSRMKKPQP
jgi:hypothetical protein